MKKNSYIITARGKEQTLENVQNLKKVIHSPKIVVTKKRRWMIQQRTNKNKSKNENENQNKNKNKKKKKREKKRKKRKKKRKQKLDYIIRSHIETNHSLDLRFAIVNF